MANEVEICNMGLSHIRSGSINALTESSVQAQQCKLWYPIVRDQVLQDAPWGFSHSLKPLALLSDSIFNWRYVYQYPTDCLRVNHLLINYATTSSDAGGSSSTSSRVYDLESLDAQFPKVNYKIFNIDGNKVIAANESELRVDYRMRVEDPNLFTLDCQEAMAFLLASKLAVPIVGLKEGRELRKDSLQLYSSYLKAALTNNSNEEHEGVPDSESILVRQS